MKRREFISLVGGAAAWPFAARAQQAGRIYRIGVLAVGVKSKLGDQQMAVLTKTLLDLGWAKGRNIQIEYRGAENDGTRIPTLAKELLSLESDVILADGTLALVTLQRETKTTPIVFVSVTDPVLSGAVASFSHPGANITGFSNFEPTVVGKYVELLKEITPGLTSIVTLRAPESPAEFITRPLLETAARNHGVELVVARTHNAAEIEEVISSLNDKPTTGLFVAGHPFFGTGPNLALITSLAKRYRVPAIYSFRHFVEAGGLMSYGNDLIDQFRQAATYIDRILKGEKASDLPVQAPSKFEMVINLNTAIAIGLTMPPTLLARADEVIE